MKKFFVFLFITFLLVPICYAEEGDYVKDKLTITNLDVKVTAAGYKNYFIEEKYNTELIFGDLPGTLYFVRNIPLTGAFYFNNKKVDYTAKMNDYNISTDTEFFVDELTTKNVRFKIGNPYDLLKEREDITILYNLLYDGKNLNPADGFYYIIAQSDYDISNTNFDVILPTKVNKEDISFSLDGKKFSNSIKGLSYNIQDAYSIIGTYNKTLKAGQKLTIKIEDCYGVDTSSLNKQSKELIVYISLGIGVVSIVTIFVILTKKRLMKRK